MRAVLISILVTAAAACGAGGGGDGEQVVAGHYPLAWLAGALGAEEVVDLTPGGAEPHDLEITTDQVDEIDDARLVLLLGGGFQPALEQVAGDDAVSVLDQLGEAGEGDPHVWLDPVLMQDVARIVAEALDADPAPVVAELEALDERFRAGLARCDRDLVVTAHEAFGRLTDRYGLRQEALAGVEPDQEPAPDRLAELADLVRDEGVTTVFTEELVAPEVAEALAREAGVDTAELDTLEGGEGDYIERMDANLAALREALGCR